MGSGLSAFICYEKKNPKYVNNTDCVSQPYKRSEYFDNSNDIVLTIVPILLALTVEGMRDDIYIGLFVRIRPKADGVDWSVLSAWRGRII